jgi:hypothetical protein
MSFQTIIDNATSITINRKKKVSQTQARDGTLRVTSTGSQVWEFRVRLPDGPRWTDYRNVIEKVETLDRVTAGSFQINKSGHEWLTRYQGGFSNTANVVATFSSGNTITYSTGGGSTSGSFRFKAGDFIQMGTAGKVYVVAADVTVGSSTISLHRPVRETAGTYTLKIGPDVTWSVFCVEFPNYQFNSRDQISWSGDFVFTENV